MNISQIWIAISLVVLAVIALLVFFLGKNRKEKRLTVLASLAFGFVVAGIVFGNDNRLIGYGLMGIGVLLAVLDIFRNRNKTI
jgi:O-antigen ligase